MVASRLAALDGKAEGIDAEPTAALDRPLVAGVIDNRDGDERRGSTGNEDESVRRRRWRPSFVDSFGTEVKGEVANPPVGFDLDGELGIVGRVLGGGGSGGLAALGREIERGSKWGEVRVHLTSRGSRWRVRHGHRWHGARGMAPGSLVATVRRRGKGEADR